MPFKRILYCCWVMLLLEETATAQQLCYLGIARNPDTGAAAYTEAYVDTFNPEGALQSTTVYYRTADGTPLADKTLHYDQHPYAPAFTFTNLVTGYSETVSWLPDGRVKLSQQDSGKKIREAILQVPSPVVADAGFNAYMRNHLDLLARGDRLHFNFLNPARLNWYRFTARGKLSAETLTVTLQPTSTLLRWLVSPITLEYDPADGRLLRYQGLTNISLAGSATLSADIHYEYVQTSPTALSQTTKPLQYPHCEIEG